MTPNADAAVEGSTAPEALAMGIVKTLPVDGAAVGTGFFATFEFDRAVEIRRLRVYRDESCTHPGQ